ncbi:ABC transporter substrate-binding protein [Floridanema evergladense]|uniref:ABC transporter substrate-binding protein n=1 Tax=Floridaenema evergladense BLCC-F167 TaxID=3153639 RepID=A0ABV4WVB2_9CYAN
MRTKQSVKFVAYIWLLVLVILTALVIVTIQGIRNNFSANGDRSLSPVSSANCRTIKHEMGETKVCGQPKKIVVFGSPILESLLTLDIQPSGFADYFMFHKGNFDKPSQQIPYLGNRITTQPANLGLLSSPSIEAILKGQPDLILGTQYNASQYKILSKIAPTLLLDWNNAEKNLKTIAEAIGSSKKAEPLLAETKQQIKTARDSFAPIVAKSPKMLLLHSGKLQDIYLGDDAFGLCSSLIKKLGFQLILPPELNKNYPVSVSIETLSQFNDADSIILLGSNFSKLDNENSFKEHQLLNLKQAWEKNAIAQSLKASKNGRVYFIPYYMCAGLPGSIGTKLYLRELKKQLLSAS